MEPLSDEQSRAQVVDPAKEIARAAGLQVTRVTFAWEWCNDQGEPPYHGRVDMVFKLPSDGDSGAYFERILSTMADQPGWGEGPVPGKRPFGDSLHKAGATVVVGRRNKERGIAQVFGECRNMNDHRDDSGWHDITDEFTGN
ncbi:hypothetical protein [Mycolicibacter acidiphilus]|uniref:hypothetical protein n=1 Tax=Mycolicibacter acidiphilus TaxID=2835306 RepID=UPI0027DB1D2E|nr:hypothetical protein [Mycolicibacter acidiphilus]